MLKTFRYYLWALLIAAVSFASPSAMADLGADAATALTAAEAQIAAYAKEILTVLIGVAIAAVLFGMTKKAH